MTTPAEELRTMLKLPAAWVLECGFQGRWHASATFETAPEARDALLRRQDSLTPGQELRLVRVETTIVRTIEGTVARAINGGQP